MMKHNIYNELKKIGVALALILSLTSLSGCLGEPPVVEVTVVSENRLDGKFFYTEYSDGTAVLTGYDGTLTELILPDTLNGLPLVAIGDQAFSNQTSLTTLRVGTNITRIGFEAFYGCTALSTVEIGAQVDAIGYYAFEGTPWLDAQEGEFILAGNGILIKYKGNAAHVVIPDHVRVLSDAFFQSETLVEATLGANVERLDAYAFAYCPNLRAVNFNEKLTVIGESAFAFCDNLRMIEIPPQVTEIGTNAFLYCTMLRQAKMGESVTVIGDYAFNYCNHLTSVDLNAALTTVGDYAFYECYILSGVCYAGSSEDWASVKIGEGNSLFTDAALHCLSD